MSNTIKGFTLVEVLVVILVSTLVLAAVGGTMVYISTFTGELMNESEEIDAAKNIENYVRALAKENHDASYIENKVLNAFLDTGLSTINIIEENGFVLCYFEFDSGKNFEFIVDII